MSVTSAKKSKFANFVRKLRIGPDTLILFQKDNVTTDALDRIAEIITSQKIPNVTIITVDDVNQVEALPRDKMEELGWFRADALLKKIKAGSNVQKTDSSAGNEDQ